MRRSYYILASLVCLLLLHVAPARGDEIDLSTILKPQQGSAMQSCKACTVGKCNYCWGKRFDCEYNFGPGGIKRHDCFKSTVKVAQAAGRGLNDADIANYKECLKGVDADYTKCQAEDPTQTAKFSCHDFAFEICRYMKKQQVNAWIVNWCDSNDDSGHTTNIVQSGDRLCIVNNRQDRIRPELCWQSPSTCGSNKAPTRESIPASIIAAQQKYLPGAQICQDKITISECDDSFYTKRKETPWFQCTNAGDVRSVLFPPVYMCKGACWCKGTDFVVRSNDESDPKFNVWNVPVKKQFKSGTIDEAKTNMEGTMCESVCEESMPPKTGSRIKKRPTDPSGRYSYVSTYGVTNVYRPSCVQESQQ